MSLPHFPLNDGNSIHPIAFGSGTVFRDTDVTKYVLQALKAGFTHVDTAQVYRNEQYVGAAIRQYGTKRENLYITTKFGGGDLRTEFEASLRKLGLEYVDLYLIHHPNLVRGNLKATWRAMERIKEEGLSKSIGVSNFTISDLEELLAFAKIKPSVNQVMFHPYNWPKSSSLLSFATKHGIVLESYSGLTPITKMPGGPLDPVLEKIAKARGATPAQIIFSWVHSKRVVIVTTSSKEERLEEYLNFAKLRPLTKEEIAEIERASTQGTPPDAKYVMPWTGPVLAN